MTQTGGTPPGWYLDNAGQWRWWDGMAWTEHVDTARSGQAPQPQQALVPWPPPDYLEGGPSDFGGSVSNAIKHTFEYRGRASRSSYWWFYLAQSLFVFAVYMVFLIVLFATVFSATDSSSANDDVDLSGGAIALIVLFAALLFIAVIAVLVVSISLTIRRLHDTDRSGWWYLIGLVPFGSIVLLVFCVLEPTPGPNRYNIDLAAAARRL